MSRVTDRDLAVLAFHFGFTPAELRLWPTSDLVLLWGLL